MARSDAATVELGAGAFALALAVATMSVRTASTHAASGNADVVQGAAGEPYPGIDRVAAQCVERLTPKWSTRLAALDVYIWDQCYSMEQSLRIE